MSVDETLMCSFQILKPTEKKAKATDRPGTPQRARVFQKTLHPKKLSP